MKKTIDLSICKKTIQQGAILRILITICLFYLISRSGSMLMSKYLFLILPVGLVLLDLIDNIPSFLHWWNQGYNKDKCTHLFAYQSTDKVIDLLSYLLAIYWFGLHSDPLFLVFCGLRACGVLGFLLTSKSYPLMIFPDLIKEYMIYRYFIPQGGAWLPAVIIAKICFEIYFHTVRNSSSYL